MGKKIFTTLTTLLLPIFLFVGIARADDGNVSVNYQTHVQKVGWQDSVSNGAMSGTTGQALRLEGIKISLDADGYSGGVEYQTHVQSIGWQGTVRDGAMSGTEGRALRLEAIQISLYGDIADDYNVCYRVHAQHFGWLDWACNGDSAGTATYAYRLEGIEIRMLKKSDGSPISTLAMNNPYETRRLLYRTHVQSDGWQDWRNDGGMAGTSGRALRLEGIEIKLGDIYPFLGGITYRTHVQKIGWQDWKSNGEMAGTEGLAYRLEAIEIKLTGILSSIYDIQYRTHVQSDGWQEWKTNGEMAGTSGRGLRLEAIEIKLVPKTYGMGGYDPNEEYPDDPQDPATPQDPNDPQDDEDPTIIRTPVVERRAPRNSYYDLGMNIKYTNPNYYVDGFEAQASEDPNFANCENSSCYVYNHFMSYDRFKTNENGEIVGLNEIVYNGAIRKSDDLTKQYVRVRAYRIINDIKYYSEYTRAYEVEYDRIYVDLDGGYAMDVWTTDQSQGVMIGPESQYYIHGTEYRLVTPTKSGYRFIGWTGSNGTELQTEVTISGDTTGELNYVAHWAELSENEYETLPVPEVVKAGPKNYDTFNNSDFSLRINYSDSNYYVNEFEVYTSTAEDGEYVKVNNITDYDYKNAYYDAETNKLMINDYSVNVDVPDDSLVRYYKVRARNLESDFDRYSPFSVPIRVEMNRVSINTDGGNMTTYITVDDTPQITQDSQMYVYGQEYRLVNPVKEGCTFEGWIGTNISEPSKDVVISADSVGALTYTAIWSNYEEPTIVQKPKLIVNETNDTPTLWMWVGYESYADWAGGFELFSASERDGDYQLQDSMNGCYTPGWYGMRQGSVNINCYVKIGISSDVYLKAIAYKIVNGEKVYSELSDEYAYMHIQPIHFNLNGGVMPEGGMGSVYQEDPIYAIAPIETGYMPGFRYSVIQPIRDGYTFAGWTGSNGAIPQIDFIIDRDVDMPLEYSAHWVKN